ncbi:MAG: nucleoside deaminase [Bacteroidales bacterium]|nr:nucleoside deaminase [Bacteroidales bacterium]MBN2699702.1 nucleoside deaminase [Bacteroidales bacterium]
MTYPIFSDEYFMNEALKEAYKAFESGEIPVGAVVVDHNRIIARAHNSTQKLLDVTAHAEMIAITAAANFLGSKYLTECTIYITLEPCLMCAGALAWSQIPRVFFGTCDPKAGYSTYGIRVFHPKTVVRSGFLEPECAQVIKRFFLERRDLKN